jgi:hypothetical protein
MATGGTDIEASRPIAYSAVLLLAFLVLFANLPITIL